MGNHDDLRLGRDSLDKLQNFLPGHPLHHHIGDNYIKLTGLEPLFGDMRVGKGFYFIAGLLKIEFYHLTDGQIIIQDQDTGFSSHKFLFLLAHDINQSSLFFSGRQVKINTHANHDDTKQQDTDIHNRPPAKGEIAGQSTAQRDQGDPGSDESKKGACFGQSGPLLGHGGTFFSQKGTIFRQKRPDP